MECDKCHGVSPEGSKFCKWCGNTLGVVQAAPAEGTVARTRPSRSKSRVVFAVVTLVIVAVSVIAAAASLLAPTPSTAPPSGGGGNTPPALTTKTAEQINLALVDFTEAGWMKYSEGHATIAAAGMSDNNTRRFVDDLGYGDVRVVDSTILVFQTVAGAQLYYSSQEATIKAKYSTEAWAVGSSSVYYKEAGDYVHLYFLRKNVVAIMTVVNPGLIFEDRLLSLAQTVDGKI